MSKRRWTEEQFRKAVAESKTITEIATRLGLSSGSGGNKDTVKNFAKANDISLEHLNGKEVAIAKLRERLSLSNSSIFVENSDVSGATVKKRILRENLILPKCRDCGLSADMDGICWWNGKPLILNLEHINGKNNDNRLINLCFLCPNCHSQTSTFAGRKGVDRLSVAANKLSKLKDQPMPIKNITRTYHKNKCNNCQKNFETDRQNQKFCSHECSNQNMAKSVPDRAALVKLVDIMDLTAIGKIYGKTANSVKNWCKKHNVKYRGRGDWAKIRAGQILPPLLN